MGVCQQVSRPQAKKMELLSESEASGEEAGPHEDWGFAQEKGGRCITAKGKKGMGKYNDRK